MKGKAEEKRKEGREARGISRREFAGRAAGAAALAAAGISTTPLGAFAVSGSGASAQQPSAPAEKLSAAGLAEADAKTQFAFATYGGRLTDAQRTDLRRLIKEGVEPLEELRKYELANGVQPATVLRLYPEPPVTSHITAKSATKDRK